MANDILVLASGNAGKLREFAALLQPLGKDLRPQSDWAVGPVAEDACSFVENALIKARHAARCTGLPALADDSGLVVPALDGAPGVRSARYSGAQGDTSGNNRKLLEAMSGLEGSDRAAYFHCAVVMLDAPQDPAPLLACASWWGEIAQAEAGTMGFGYDPLFWLPRLHCTSAQLERAAKDRLSHRGLATRQLIRLLEARRER